MLVKLIFGVGCLTLILGLGTLFAGLFDYIKNPHAYKQNTDREPWRN